jgi:hypothetical protein
MNSNNLNAGNFSAPKSTSSASKQNTEVDVRENLDKKIEELGKLPKNSKFAGMSPIITFRPLNKFSNEQSSQNTPLGTP